MINDLYYPPAHNQNAIFFITRPVDHLHIPVDITAIRASLVHIHHTDLDVVAPGLHKLCLYAVHVGYVCGAEAAWTHFDFTQDALAVCS